MANPTPSPRRVAAGRITGPLRRPWTPEDRRRQRANCLATRPWEHSTGPRTASGKATCAHNGRNTPPVPGSRRQARGSVVDVQELIRLNRGLLGELGL